MTSVTINRAETTVTREEGVTRVEAGSAETIIVTQAQQGLPGSGSPIDGVILADGTIELDADWFAGNHKITAKGFDVYDINEDTILSISNAGGTGSISYQSSAIEFDPTYISLSPAGGTGGYLDFLTNNTSRIKINGDGTINITGATTFTQTIYANNTSKNIQLASSGFGSGSIIMPVTASAYSYTMPAGTCKIAGDAIANIFSQPQTIGGVRFLGYTSSVGTPTTTQLPNNRDCAIHEDSLGSTYFAYNRGGTIRRVTLS